MDMPEDELNSWQKELDVASEILLSIEFDVEEPEVKSGTFRVELQKVAKIGIHFKATRRGSPMVVSGVTKGSAAHRSGAIFPGDEILFFDFVKTEKYDPCTCDYTRKDMLLLTVHRSPIDTITDILQSENRAERKFHDSEEESLLITENSFIVKKSSTRATDRNGTVILETEVILFKNTKCGGFGIRIGQDKRSDRVYVMDIRHDGPAYSCGVIQKFDRIVKVNGIRVDKNSALKVFKEAGNSVHLSLRRRLYFAPNE
ncbi:glutamate receptor-interacting protein 2-like [Stegodyphus dumicola]|uniref:glutamate receptor-interacting protein 2-like n=1 Tax=Stegodyphus dumicola TaxID=202533 RepID=UPI0015ADBCA9|nr:glutamate receptor-interacting protein 2-like [Stegodyphus dumicola]